MSRSLQHTPEYTSPQVFEGLDRQGAAAAFSLRRLFESYTGALVTVRRAHDNTERDFGFDYSGLLDVRALRQWVGDVDPSGHAFVARWYDQSGNANHAVQSAAARQPQIVENGAVITDGSKPTLSFTATVAPFPRVMTILSFTALNTINQPVSTFAVHRRIGVTATYMVVFDVRNTPGGDMFTAPYHAFNTGGQNKYFVNVNRRASGATAHLETEYTFPTTQALTSYVFDGTNGRTYINGTPINAWTDQQLALAPDFSEASIGGIIEGVNVYPAFTGEISELVIYSANKAPVRTVIEGNIKKTYNL